MSSRRISGFVCVVVALLTAACSGEQHGSYVHSDDHVVHWGYEDNDGPQVWSAMNSAWSMCAEGREQSPIDLGNTEAIDLPATLIETPSGEQVEVLNQKGVINALDNGHTIQINASTGETLTHDGKQYALVQFHFHAPSEHTVGGKHYPMEMHFVHQADDGALAVVGVFIDEGPENPGVAPLWAQLEESAGAPTEVRMSKEFADQIFYGSERGVFHYVGSLTTPPCSEGVQWFVRQAPTHLSREQIEAFTAVYDHNNRPVQELHGRTIFYDGNPAVTIK